MMRAILLVIVFGMLLGGCSLALTSPNQELRDSDALLIVVFVFLALLARKDLLFLVAIVSTIAACTPSASAATLTEIEALNAVSCEIESRAERFRDLASSVAGAKGRCQMLPATALWMVTHAVRMGHLPRDYLAVRSLIVWSALLSVPWVSDALAMTYKQWIAARRDRNLRMIAYLYHAGQDARWRTGTESWRHSAEVYLAYQARRMAAGKSALVVEQ